MNSVADRSEALDFVATTLLIRASKVSRLLMASARSHEISRTEAGMLGTLVAGPRRITELARTEAIAQPSVSRLVDGLAARGLVTREVGQADRRVVLVTITAQGREALETLRAHNRAELRELLGELDDDEVLHLAAASETLGTLLESLQVSER